MSTLSDRESARIATEKEAARSQNIVGVLVLVLAIVLVYLPVRSAGFIWDDNIYITGNHAITGPGGLKEIWTSSAADVSPLAMTTFWLEHALWGVAAGPFHLVNVFAHAACAVALWQVLRSLKVPGAWLGAALWALHPVMVESVAWVAELKNPESGLFFLISIFFFIRWLRVNPSGWNYGGALFFAALAMAAKSSTIVLPFILCLCAWWLERRWRWRNVLISAPFLVLSAASGFWSFLFQHRNIALTDDLLWMRTWPERLVTAGDAVWFYLDKLVWPSPLMTVYPRPKIEAENVISYLPLLAVFVLLFLLWLRRDSWTRPWFFTFAYFLLALLPVLGLAENTIFRYALVFDHFQYLAAMGPLALAGAGLTRAADSFFANRRLFPATLGALLLLTLGVVSWQRTWVYQSRETLWTDALEKNPAAWVGYLNLGNVRSEEGHIDEAMADFRKVIELNPGCAEAYNNLGNTLMKKGQLEEARVDYRKAVELVPRYAEAEGNIGHTYYLEGKIDDAIAEYRKALQIEPDDVTLHNSLGGILFKKGDADQAAEELRMSLTIDPDNSFAHFGLGMIFLQKNEPAQAIAEFQETLRLQPDFAGAESNLAKAQTMAQQNAAH